MITDKRVVVIGKGPGMDTWDQRLSDFTVCINSSCNFFDADIVAAKDPIEFDYFDKDKENILTNETLARAGDYKSPYISKSSVAMAVMWLHDQDVKHITFVGFDSISGDFSVSEKFPDHVPSKHYGAIIKDLVNLLFRLGIKAVFI